MKITASVTKSFHEDCGPCYLHFFSYIYTLLLCRKICFKVVLTAVFPSKLDHRPFFNDVYYETILGFNMINKRHTQPIV